MTLHRYYPISKFIMDDDGTVDDITEDTYDADTLTLMYEVDRDDKHNVMFAQRRCRLYGINAWEVRGEEKEKGKIAKAAFQALLTDAPFIRGEFHGKGKYGRKLVTLYASYDKETYFCINDWLVDEGHAVYRDY